MQPVACQFDMPVLHATIPGLFTHVLILVIYAVIQTCYSKTVLMLTKRKLRIKIFSCKKLYQVRTETHACKVHFSVHLKLLEHFMCEAASSKYLSPNIPKELNVDKYCCENLTILNPLLQYITQICHLTEYSITVTFYC